MSSSALAAGLRLLRGKLAVQQYIEDSDEELLHLFLSRRDDSAFAALVHRHGPMVLHVCRRVLGHEQDAEDAFQATFLVLAQSAARLRKKSALGSWLHGIAYRLAMKTKQAAARRRKREEALPRRAWERGIRPPVDPADELSWREVRTFLDEEIARLPETYRSVFILCVLESVSVAETARRLGLKQGTVASRLAEARKRLQQCLTRRGVELTAVLAASTLAAQLASALSPILISTTIKAATATALGQGTAGLISVHVAGLVKSAASAAMVSKMKMATVVLLALALLAVATSGSLVFLHGRASGPLAATPGPPAAKAESEPPIAAPPVSAKRETAKTIDIQGRVLDPDGKPVRGAKLLLAFQRTKQDIPSKIWATSTNEGRFQFTIPRMLDGESLWKTPDDQPYVLAAAKGFGFAAVALEKPEAAANLTLQLVKDDVPIRGRVLNLEGKPIAGVRVHISDDRMFHRNGLHVPKQGDLTAWLAALKTSNRTPGQLDQTYLTSVCSPCFDLLFPAVTTGADGRFEIRGIGRERVADLFLEGPTIATQVIAVMTRSHETIRRPRDRANPKGQMAVYYGSDCTVLTEPTKPVVGVVRDRDTGKPLAGVRIMSNKIANPWNISNHQWGLLRTITDKEGRYRLVGLPKGHGNELLATTDDLPYLPWSKKVENTPGLGPVAVNFALKRGIWVKGRITEKGTGKPLRGGIGYYCFRDNPHMKEIPRVVGATDRLIRKDGSFQLVAAPGHGVIRLYLSNDYLDGASAEKIKGPRIELGGTEFFATVPYWCPIDSTVIEINPKAGEESIALDLIAVPFPTLKGTVLGPDGKPLAGAHRGGWETLPGSEFTIDLPPGKLREPWEIEFVHEGKKLAGFVTIRGDEKESLQVHLQPWGAVTGRLVNPQGEPLTGVRASCHAGDDLPDKNGHFHIEGLTPGLKYHLYVSKEGRALLILGGEPKDLIVKPGETLDLGVLKVKVME